MRTSSYHYFETTDGWQVNGKNELLLGTDEGGCRIERVKLDPRRPAIVEEGIINYASLRHVTRRGNKYRKVDTLISDPQSSGKTLAVRVSTSTPDEGTLFGTIKEALGNPQLYTIGRGCYGKGQPRFSDDIYIMRSGDAIRIIHAGSGRIIYLINLDGDLTMKTQSEFDRWRSEEKRGANNTKPHSIKKSNRVKRKSANEIEKRVEDMTPAEASKELDRICGITTDPFDQ